MKHKKVENYEVNENINWLLICLIVLSLIAHGVLIYHTALFKVKKVSTIELIVQDIPAKVDRPVIHPPVLQPHRRIIPEIPQPLRRTFSQKNSIPKFKPEILPDFQDLESLPVIAWQPKKPKAAQMASKPVAKIQERAKTQTPPVNQPASHAKNEQGNELEKYLVMIQQRIKRHRKYPLWARRRQFEGKVIIRFTISPKGVIGGAKISKSSGHKILDQAAINALRLASPVPAPPVGLSEKQSITLAIIFKLQ